MSLPLGVFTCDMCHLTFEKGWSDEECEEEMTAIFGYIPPEKRGVVCDPCATQVMLWWMGLSSEERERVVNQ